MTFDSCFRWTSRIYATTHLVGGIGRRAVPGYRSISGPVSAPVVKAAILPPLAVE
jgi:hypothetical protein